MSASLQPSFETVQTVQLQSDGALLAIQEQDNIISFASDNAGVFLGYPAELMGKNAAQTLCHDLYHDLRNASSNPLISSRRIRIGRHRPATGQCIATVFRSGEHLILELRNAPSDNAPSAFDILKDVQTLGHEIADATSVPDLFRRVTMLMRSLSGYRAVVALRLEKGRLVPITEPGRRASTVALPFGPQHYAVHDVDAPTVMLPANAAPLDLTASALRAPGPDLRRELAKEGVAAFFTFGLFARGRPWGGLAFFHGKPRIPGDRTILVLEHIEPVLSHAIERLTDA